MTDKRKPSTKTRRQIWLSSAPHATLRTRRCSNNNKVKNLARLHANKALKRFTKAAVTRPCKSWGDSCFLAFAKPPRKSAVSSDHRPPTALPSSPVKSGYVLSIALRASRKATQLVAVRRAEPITTKRRHQRGVHCELGSVPQGETVHDDLDAALMELNAARSRSRTNLSTATRPTASLHTCAAARSSGNPLVPNTPALEHAARYTHQEGGHIGRCDRTVGVGERGVDTITCKMVVGRVWSLDRAPL